jgi:hypothetical protein
MKKFGEFIDRLVQIQDGENPPVPARKFRSGKSIPETPNSPKKPSSKFDRLRQILAAAALTAPPVSGAFSGQSHPMGYPPPPPMKATVNENIRRPKKMG